jgi:outer membrane protein insertion porin family
VGGRLSPLLPLLLGVAIAQAEQAPWYVGRPVYQVSLEAPVGGLPEDNLEPLLAAQQGDILTLDQIRRDINLLYMAGRFEAVEAWVEPWDVPGPDDTLEQMVRLVYVVMPPAHVVDIRVEGARGAAAAAAIEGLDLDLGEPLFMADDYRLLAQRVVGRLRDEGWPEATATVRVDEEADRELSVTVSVDAGSPRVLGEVDIGGDRLHQRLPIRRLFGLDANRISERQVRRWLWRAGLHKGRRITMDDFTEARQSVKDHLVDDGFLGNRVSLVFFPLADGVEDLRLQIEGGPHLEVHLSGRSLPSRSELLDATGIEASGRVDGTTVDQVREEVERWHQQRGFPGSRVEVGLEVLGDDQRLVVEARRGPLHITGDIEFVGAESYSQSFLTGVLREASPEDIGRRLYSKRGVERAMVSLVEFYRGEGFLNARVELDAVNMRGPSWLFPTRPLAVGRTADLRIRVEEGVQTELVRLTSTGGIGVEDSLLAERVPELVGARLRPAEMDRLARQVADAYRDAGYLEAVTELQTQVVVSNAGRSEATGQLRITPGPQVRVRSIVVQGNRRTRRRVIERALPLAVGDPVSPAVIAQTRQELYDLDLFRSVVVEVDGDEARSRDLVVRLDERPNLLFEVGGGVSTDEGFAVRGRAAHRNLGGMARRASAVGQVGYAWETDQWRVDVQSPVWRAALRFEAPEVPTRDQALSAEILLNERYQEQTFRMTRFGASLGWRADLSSLDLIGDFRGQVRRLEDLDPGALVVGDPWYQAVQAETGASNLLVLPSRNRYVVGPQLQIVRDRRVPRLDPRSGDLALARASMDVPLLGEPLRLQASTRLERLVPAGPIILSVVGAAGLGWAAGEGTTLPVEDRFYLGGADSLRGFAIDAVGPANQVRRPDIDFPDQIGPVVNGLALNEAPLHWVSTGGDSMVSASAEVRVPASLFLPGGSDSAWLVMFMDVGHVGFLDSSVVTTSQNPADPSDTDPFLRTSIGAGFRFSTPVGPASLVLGVNPSPLDGRGESWVIPHFSLGAL